MAINTSDNRTGYEDVIANNIPSRAFRYTAENKNLLQAAGSIYVGKGDTRTTKMVIQGEQSSSVVEYESAVTTALNPPSGLGTYVLKCIVASDTITIGWVEESDTTNDFKTKLVLPVRNA